MKSGIELILEERQEQVLKHGRTVQSDVDANDNKELVIAAKALLNQPDDFINLGEFPASWNPNICERMAAKPFKERCVIAAALLAAQIDVENYHENDFSISSNSK